MALVVVGVPFGSEDMTRQARHRQLYCSARGVSVSPSTSCPFSLPPSPQAEIPYSPGRFCVAPRLRGDIYLTLQLALLCVCTP